MPKEHSAARLEHKRPTDKQKRNEMALQMFNKSWRQLDGFLRHAVMLALGARR